MEFSSSLGEPDKASYYTLNGSSIGFEEKRVEKKILLSCWIISASIDSEMAKFFIRCAGLLFKQLINRLIRCLNEMPKNVYVNRRFNSSIKSSKQKFLKQFYVCNIYTGIDNLCSCKKYLLVTFLL
ncbi:hypothetical protein CHUAL_014033 [Chamberlinius hualienensis]